MTRALDAAAWRDIWDEFYAWSDRNAMHDTITPEQERKIARLVNAALAALPADGVEK